MAISYNGLWKLLIDKGMKKGDLCKSTGLSSSTMAKMTNGESVNLSVLERICEELDCDFADLVNHKKLRRKNPLLVGATRIFLRKTRRIDKNEQR